MKRTHIFTALITAASLSACVSPVPLVVNNDLPLLAQPIAASCSADSQVANSDLKTGAASFGGSIYLTKGSQPTFPELLKADLEELCQNGFVAPVEDRAVRISVTSAVIYYERKAADSVPGVGLATAFNARPVVAEAEFFLEFEEGGFVQRTRTFSHQTKIVHSVAMQADVEDAMIAVVEQFREEAFNELNAEVLGRYTWPD